MTGTLPGGVAYVFGHESDPKVTPGKPGLTISAVYNPRTGQLGFARAGGAHARLLRAAKIGIGDVDIRAQDAFAHVTVWPRGGLDIVPPYTQNPLEEKRLVGATLSMLRRRGIETPAGKVTIEWATDVNRERFGRVLEKLLARRYAQPSPFSPNYARIEETLDALQAQLVPRLQRVFVAAKDKVKDLVRRKMDTGALDVRFLEALELRGLGDLVPLLRAYLQAAFGAGGREARDELGRLRGRRYQLPFLTITDPSGRQARVPLSPGRAPSAGQARRIPLAPGEVPPTAAIAYFEDKALAWRGILADDLLADIKTVLLGAITNGEPVGETMDALERVFGPYVGDLAALPDQEQTQPYRIETLIRTMTGEAFNAGRLTEFEDAAAEGFITGYEFDATLDQRTTAVCNFLGKGNNGRPFILPPSGEKLARLAPPRCWQCRSLLSPITRIENPNPEIISDEDFQRAVELSCEGFSEAARARAYADAHTFSSTQLNLPPVLQARFHGWVAARLTPDDLSPDEKLDDAFHVTVLYGLHGTDGKSVAEAVAGFGLVAFRLGDVKIFNTNPAYDVLYVAVEDAVDLRVLRGRLEKLPHTKTRATYVPHATLAYVKKGAGQRLVGDRTFAGERVVVDRLLFRSLAGDATWVSLLPGAKPYAAPIDPLKKGETIEIGPEGKRGVWRTIGGNPIFIEVEKGESIPEAVRRTTEEAEKGRPRRRAAPAVDPAAVRTALPAPLAKYADGSGEVDVVANARRLVDARFAEWRRASGGTREEFDRQVGALARRLEQVPLVHVFKSGAAESIATEGFLTNGELLARLQSIRKELNAMIESGQVGPEFSRLKDKLDAIGEGSTYELDKSLGLDKASFFSHGNPRGAYGIVAAVVDPAVLRRSGTVVTAKDIVQVVDKEMGIGLSTSEPFDASAESRRLVAKGYQANMIAGADLPRVKAAHIVATRAQLKAKQLTSTGEIEEYEVKAFGKVSAKDILGYVLLSDPRAEPGGRAPGYQPDVALAGLRRAGVLPDRIAYPASFDENQARFGDEPSSAQNVDVERDPETGMWRYLNDGTARAERTAQAIAARLVARVAKGRKR